MKEGGGNEKLYFLFQKLGGIYPSMGTIFLHEDQRNEELRKILEVYLENGKLNEAVKTAKLLTEPHRTEVFAGVIKRLLGMSWFSDALDLAGLLSEPQRTIELVRMFEMYQDGNLDIARKAANLLAEPERTKKLAMILEKYIVQGFPSNAQMTADMILKNHQE